MKRNAIRASLLAAVLLPGCVAGEPSASARAGLREGDAGVAGVAASGAAGAAGAGAGTLGNVSRGDDSGAAPVANRQQALDALVQPLLDGEWLMGAAIALVSGEAIETHAYGTLRASGPAVDARTGRSPRRSRACSWPTWCATAASSSSSPSPRCCRPA